MEYVITENRLKIMKYIITENRLNDIIFKYLDMRLNKIEKMKGVNTDIIFAFPSKKYGLLGWEKSGVLYVFYEFRDEIKNMFGLESPDALDVIARYVVDRYNLEVKHAFLGNSGLKTQG
jgi:hypothetical protein